MISLFNIFSSSIILYFTYTTCFGKKLLYSLITILKHKLDLYSKAYDISSNIILSNNLFKPYFFMKKFITLFIALFVVISIEGQELKNYLINYLSSYMLSSAKLIDSHSNLYSSQYKFNNKVYQYLFYKKRNFINIISAYAINSNSQEIDVTKLFEQYYGPCCDFHSIKLKPKQLGWNQLKVDYIDDLLIQNQKTFYQDDIIQL